MAPKTGPRTAAVLVLTGAAYALTRYLGRVTPDVVEPEHERAKVPAVMERPDASPPPRDTGAVSDLRTPRASPYPQALWLVLAVSVLYAGYFVLRYGGLWTENDTSVFSREALRTVESGSILFPGQYVHGFGYPAWLSSLSLLTGVPAPILNTVVMPYVGMVMLVLSGFMAYRMLCGSDRVALLAVSLLFAVPDLLFSVLRGNHEKLNVFFMLAAIYLLLKGFQATERRRFGRTAIWVVLFDASIFANATANDYFASSFVAAMTLTVLGAYVLSVVRPVRHAFHIPVPRLALRTSASWLLVLSFGLFLFRPASQDLQLIATTADKVNSLFLSLKPASNPYAIASQQWAGGATSTLLGTFRLLLFFGSIGVWIFWLWRGLIRRTLLSVGRSYLILLYGAFGLLIALSIPVDLVGLSSGTNLQLRNFTYFALLAAPVLGWGLRDLFRLWLHAPGNRRRSAHSVRPFAAGLVAIVVALGVVKTTVDPLVSNLWIFYSPTEHQALAEFLRPAQAGSLWVGPDNRLHYVADNWDMYQLIGQVAAGPRVQETTDWLRSPQLVANMAAQGYPLPPFGQQDRVYDNGGAQVFHVAPQTPFQD